MTKENEYALQKYRNALNALESALEEAKSQLECDGVIQRFEFTYELCWKTLKIALRYQGMESRTPRETFKIAFKIGWINKQEVFLNMIDDRNRTSHIYNEDMARKIYDHIKAEYLTILKDVLIRLEREM